MFFPLPVDCQHVNGIKHRPVGAHKASVSTKQIQQVEFQLHVIHYLLFPPKLINVLKFISPSILHQSCFILRYKIRQKIRHTTFLKHTTAIKQWLIYQVLILFEF